VRGAAARLATPHERAPPTQRGCWLLLLLLLRVVLLLLLLLLRVLLVVVVAVLPLLLRPGAAVRPGTAAAAASWGSARAHARSRARAAVLLSWMPRGCLVDDCWNTQHFRYHEAFDDWGVCEEVMGVVMI
jgi:hypothetical protein